MGALQAIAMSETDLTLEQQLAWHLSSNCYPPIPASMVQPCIDAIDAYWADELDNFIKLPDGVSWRGSNSAPAREIIINHHLDSWCSDSEDSE